MSSARSSRATATCAWTGAAGRWAGTSISAEFTLVPRPFDHPDVQALIALIQDYYLEIYGSRDEDRTDPAEFAPPNGLFLVGYRGEQPVVSGGWRLLDPETAEVKRMFVDPALRGTGLAHRMLADLERTARAAGAVRMTLNTGFRQTDAIAFYEAHGYVRTDQRYGHYLSFEGAYFFAKDL